MRECNQFYLPCGRIGHRRKTDEERLVLTCLYIGVCYVFGAHFPALKTSCL